MKLGPILFVTGLLTGAIGVAMAIVGVYSLLIGGTMAGVFEVSAAITLFVSGALTLANRQRRIELDHRQAFVLTAVAWIACAAFAALPFAISGKLGYTDAFFETMSGLTTTGATVISGLDGYPRSLLLWRSIMQWLGGIGIIVMALAILPFLGVGGMQLYKSESSDKVDKTLPRPGQIAAVTAQVYLGLTLACAFAYSAAGMGGFDAVNHAMTTVATAGFSTRDASLGAFGPEIVWIASVFMFLGALPFILYARMVQGEFSPLWRDAQVRAFALLVAVTCLIMSLWLGFARGYAPFDAATHGVFNVMSIATTTGYASQDYVAWGAFSQMVFLVLMITGACAGSTGGGVKIFRLQILALAVREQLARLVHPHAVSSRTWNRMRVGEEVFASVFIFFTLYGASVLVLSVLIAATGSDKTTAFSAALSAIGNIGPGLSAEIGPAGNYAGLSDAAKWLMAAGMLLGRLELLTLLILITPRFWRA